MLTWFEHFNSETGGKFEQLVFAAFFDVVLLFVKAKRMSDTIQERNLQGCVVISVDYQLIVSA